MLEYLQIEIHNLPQHYRDKNLPVHLFVYKGLKIRIGLF